MKRSELQQSMAINLTNKIMQNEHHCFINPSSPTGAYGFNDILDFGKNRGLTINQILNGKNESYMYWMTHALTAEKFTVNLATEIVQIMHDRASKKSITVYIDGGRKKYQMAKYYLDKIGKANMIEKPRVPDIKEAVKQSKKEFEEITLKYSLEQLKKEMDTL